MKKGLRETQTLRALAVLRRSQKYSPRHNPFPLGAGRPKFNQLEMVTTFTYRPSLVKIDARNIELSWKQTPPARHKLRPSARPPSARPSATDRTDYNTLRRYA